MSNWFTSDSEFDKIYPPEINFMARIHWTPILVAKAAAQFLSAGDNKRILDIGSGVGKFCLAGSHFYPNASYFGVEQRKPLVNYADSAKESLKMENVSFVHANFTQLSLANYDNFYFYNSFHENLDDTDKLDQSIEYSEELFEYYSRYLFQELETVPQSTRLATYHSMHIEIPPGFEMVKSDFKGLLKLWVKV